MARVVRDLASLGNLPSGDINVFPSDGKGETVSILQLETAGGVDRLESTPV